MDEPLLKRKRTHSPDDRASSPLRQPPRRPSASPTKASLARNYPNLAPSRSTSRLSASPKRRGRDGLARDAPPDTEDDNTLRARKADRNAPLNGREDDEDSELPNTPSQQRPEEPRRGILFSSPSKRPPRVKNTSKQSPLKQRAPAVQSDDVTKTVEDGPAEQDTQEDVVKQPPDPEIERRKQEKAQLQRELEILESQVSRCAEEIEKEQRRGPNEALPPQERRNLSNFISEISGTDTEPEKPTVSSLLCSFLPFSAMPIPQPRPKQSDRPVPSHRPVKVADPLPYLEMFTSFKFSTQVSLSRRKVMLSSRQAQQKHIIDVSGPHKLLTAQFSVTIDTLASEIVDSQVLRLSPWAEPELGSFIRARAQQKDLSNASWAIDSYWDIASKRAQHWHRCETVFSHLVEGRTEKDMENARQPQKKSAKAVSRRDLNRNLGRDTLVLQDKHVLLKLNWRIGFDWTGEAESDVTVEAAFPQVWSETDRSASLKKVPETFASLLRSKGAFEATRIMVALLFAQ